MTQSIKKTLKVLNKIYPLVFSAILIYFLASKLKEYNFIEQILKIRWWIVAVVLIMFGAIKLSNTFRYASLYKIKEKKKLFLVLSFCNSFLSLLPFRLGEVSYVKSFKDYFNISHWLVAKKLVLLRFFDLIVVYLLFFISSFYIGSTVKGDVVGCVSLLIFGGLLVGLLIFFIVFILKKNNLFTKNKYYQSLANLVEKTRKELFRVDKKAITILFFYSLLYWFLRIFSGFLVLNFLGLELDFFLVAFVSLLLLLIGLFPIKTFADFGIFEGGWTYFLVLIGFNYQEVLPTIINFHILSLLPAVFYGLIGWMILKTINFKNS